VHMSLMTSKWWAPCQYKQRRKLSKGTLGETQYFVYAFQELGCQMLTIYKSYFCVFPPYVKRRWDDRFVMVHWYRTKSRSAIVHVWWMSLSECEEDLP
jgi:hypothetical protein